jgi:glycosyltransferase involved in cell wall biosynthesis
MTASNAAMVTVLMPLKNYHSRFLRESIGSLFGQTDPAWRLLVICEPEDMDRFRTLLADSLRDERVRLIASEGRKLAGAFNTGMRTAQTAFVAILLSDDLWAANAVESLSRNIRGYPDADFFHSARRIINENGEALSSVHQPADHVSSDDLRRGAVKHLLCWRRQKALSFGGMDETLNSIGPDDYDFPWLMLEHGAQFHAVHECLYIYRDHHDGYRLTTHLPRSVHLRELRHILKKHGVERPLIARALREAKRGFLRECVYRNEFHRRLLDLLGVVPKARWRQSYR